MLIYLKISDNDKISDNFLINIVLTSRFDG
nr:MAG TPA: hypothetical protein [Caudoviricetes sp.]